MDITEKNGQPSMEEILASIRRIIAEEPPGPPAGIDISGRISTLPDSAIDEAADFELPSIFRNTAPQTPEKAPLLGRLTDAIRNAAATAEAKPVRETVSDVAENGHAVGYQNGRTNGHNGHNGHANGYQNGQSDQQPQYPALSTLKRTEQPQQPTYASDTAAPVSEPAAETGAAWPFAPAPEMSAADQPDEGVKRIMTPFKDTRFRTMNPGGASESSDVRASLPPDPHAHAPMPAPAPAPTMAYTPPAPSPVAAAAPYVHPAAPVVQSFPHVVASPAMPQPPPGPPPLGQQHLVPTATGTIEDTTADLLRPMLRQWLADNMPRMVEKALHIEVAESVKTGKPSGQ